MNFHPALETLGYFQSALRASFLECPYNVPVPRDLEDLVPYCPKCGYNLTGLTENRCPECGTAFDPVDLLKRGLLLRQLSLPRLIIPNLIVAPIILSGVVAFLGLDNPLLFVPLLMLFVIYMIRNGKKVQGMIMRKHAEQSGIRNPLGRGGITTYVLLQIVFLAIFWGGIIWFLVRNPPRFFGL